MSALSSWLWPSVGRWCARRDSNPHASRQPISSRRLPDPVVLLNGVEEEIDDVTGERVGIPTMEIELVHGKRFNNHENDEWNLKLAA